MHVLMQKCSPGCRGQKHHGAVSYMHRYCNYFSPSHRDALTERSRAPQLVHSHDGGCDSVKCSSVLCATVSPRPAPTSSPASPRSAVSLLWDVWQEGAGFITITLVWGRLDGTSFLDARVNLLSHVSREWTVVGFFLLWIFVTATLLMLEPEMRCAQTFLCVITVKTLPCSHLSNLSKHTDMHTYTKHPKTLTHTHTLSLTEWFIDWGGAFSNYLQLSAVKVDTNLSTAAILHVCVCFISCEGVLNLRMAGSLAHGLFPCCLGNHVAVTRCPSQSSCELGAVWSRSGACHFVWAVMWEWWVVSHPRWLSPLCHSAVGQRTSELQLRRKLTKIHTVTEILKWDMLTAHGSVKHRLMEIVKLEHCFTQSCSCFIK